MTQTVFIQKDLKLTAHDDGSFTAVALLTGPSTTFGPNGKAIARDPGQIRLRFTVDADGNETVEQIKGSTGRSDDFCAAVVPVLT